MLGNHHPPQMKLLSALVQIPHFLLVLDSGNSNLFWSYPIYAFT